MSRLLVAFVFMLLPKRLKFFCYRVFFGYQLHSSAKIGYSLILPGNLVMLENSRIGHLNVIKGLSSVTMDYFSTIGSLNWITGFPKNLKKNHFADQVSRMPVLEIGEHSAITNRHLIDCTDRVSIGRFTTFAGFRSQILTHSISMAEARQRSGPVSIGDYVFVGTASVFLPNSSLPSFSVLGAGSVLNKKFDVSYQLYAGNPARPIKPLSKTDKYFCRVVGFIV